MPRTRKRGGASTRRLAAGRNRPLSKGSVFVDDGVGDIDHLAATVVAVLGDVMATMHLARGGVGGQLRGRELVVPAAHATGGRRTAAFGDGHDDSPDLLAFEFAQYRERVV